MRGSRNARKEVGNISKTTDMTINKGDIHHTTLEKWPELSDIDKPLMIVFPDNVIMDKVRDSLEAMPGCARVYGHPLSGHEQCFYKGKFLPLKEYPEMWDIFGKTDPESYREGETTFFLYYRYQLQFEAVSLDYCRSLSKRHHLPSIFLVNDYEYEALDEAQKIALSHEFEIVNLFNHLSEKELRSQHSNENYAVPEEPGICRCWLPSNTAGKFMADVMNHTGTIKRGMMWNSIIRKQIHGEPYWCLYREASKNLRHSVGWNNIQLHSTSDVATAALSKLHKLIETLPRQEESSSEQSVNDVLDQCYWDWCATPSHDDAKRIEAKTLATGYFPLNVQENKGMDASIVRQLKQLRKAYKK